MEAKGGEFRLLEVLEVSGGIARGQKNDYHLEAGHHRSTQMWYVRLHAIVMSLHLDTWLAS